MEPVKHGKKPLENPPILGIEKLASATECTGLTPAAIQTPGGRPPGRERGRQAQ